MSDERYVKKSKQLRGIMFEAFLISQLELWWASRLDSGAPFIYRQLELSKKAGVSRG
jgi:hypothetical protein